MKNIVVAIEFDEELDDILAFTRDLVEGTAIEVHVVHAYQPNSGMVDYGPYLIDSVENYEEHLMEQSDTVRKIVAGLLESDVKASGYMKPINRNLVDSIMEFVAEKDGDLIVVGSHHPGKVERFLLGSVTENIVRASGVPVIVVPRGARE